jgi:hypothetical protein
MPPGVTGPHLASLHRGLKFFEEDVSTDYKKGAEKI